LEKTWVDFKEIQGFSAENQSIGKQWNYRVIAGKA
jgi:hypothetical protein